MSDVGKIPGERGFRPSEDLKRKKGPDSEAFREIMKVGRVRETDPDEQSRRRSQAEVEEETPPEHRSKPSEARKSQASKRSQKEKSTRPTQKKKRGNTAPKELATPAVGKVKKKKRKAAPKELTTPAAEKGEKEVKQKDKPPLEPHLAKPVKKEGVKTQLSQVNKRGKVEEPKKKEKEVTEQTEDIRQHPLPLGGWEATKKAEKKDESANLPLEVETPLPTTQISPLPVQLKTTPAPLTSPFAHLPPQIAEIFERMVGVMTIMNESGITETTITLDNPQYAKSIFYGVKIVISEYSTAPKEFNIELSANQQALNLMEGNAKELVAAFQAGRYNFKVNRFDLSQRHSGAEVKRRKVKRVKRKKTGGG